MDANRIATGEMDDDVLATALHRFDGLTDRPFEIGRTLRQDGSGAENGHFGDLSTNGFLPQNAADCFHLWQFRHYSVNSSTRVPAPHPNSFAAEAWLAITSRYPELPTTKQT